MKVLVIGSGAREHALVWRLARDPDVAGVIAAPGNPGMSGLARTIAVDPGDPDALLSVAERERVDLTVVGPELPLARGVADLFRGRGKPIVGPSRKAARLETSKVYAKEFMARHGVPTARYRVCSTEDEALAVARRGELGWPLVVKADGLAAGKGVVVTSDAAGAEGAIRGAMVERQFGDAGARLVLEEFMEGTEASFFVLCDGRDALPLTSAQDHKRVFDGDRGPNTGGMGAFAPSPIVTPEIERRVTEEIVTPVLEGLRAEGDEYSGFLYVGLMLAADGPRVVEFNVRLGDPEAQVIVPMIESGLAALLDASARGTLRGRHAVFSSMPHVGVVLASSGYPGAVKAGKPIAGVDAAERGGALVFHAGTAVRDGVLVTAGGRVLTVVGRGRTYDEAIERAYDGAAKIVFDGMHYRRDIGRRAAGAARPETLKS